MRGCGNSAVNESSCGCALCDFVTPEPQSSTRCHPRHERLWDAVERFPIGAMVQDYQIWALRTGRFGPGLGTSKQVARWLELTTCSMHVAACMWVLRDPLEYLTSYSMHNAIVTLHGRIIPSAPVSTVTDL